MPKLKIPKELLADDKKNQLAEFKERNNICTFKQFFDAVVTGNVQKVQKLNYLDSYLNDKTDSDNAALIVAVANGYVKMVKYLLDEGANPDISTKIGIKGFTSLHMAVRDSNIPIIKLLLEKGANIEVQECRGWTPLHLAAFQGDSHVEIAKLLINNGANLKAKTKDKTLAGYDGCTPLHLAAEYGFHGQAKMIKLLLSYKADLEARSDLNCTPLQWAAAKGSEEGVQALLDNGADIEAKVDGCTPLYIAAQNNRLEIVTMLLNRGADINAKADDGSTPLSRAYKERHFEVVAILKQRGAELEQAVNPRVVVKQKDKPKSNDSKGFEFMKDTFNKNVQPVTKNAQRIMDATQPAKRKTVLADSPLNSKENIRKTLNTVVPNQHWKVPSPDKAWLQLADEREAQKIVNHFKRNNYQAIKLSHRKDSPDTPVIVIEVDYNKLINIPTLEILEEDKQKNMFKLR